jgi:uncharacterized RDD family membrane protein YckC
MDERLTISTPEQVAFQYEMADIGSRFVASLLDHIILGLALALVACAVLTLSLGAMLSQALGDNGQMTGGMYLAIAVLVLIIFLIFWGYFILFEMVWKGQTPGKRLVRLRVIRQNGQPVGAGEVVVRNLVRLVDILPGFYGIGLISMFIDKQARRLGDFAAGTVVVREGDETSLQDVRVDPATAAPAPAGTLFDQAGQYRAEPARAYDPLPGISLRGLGAEDYRLVQELLSRVRRGEMPPERSYELAYRLAMGVAARIGHDFREWHARGWDPVTFLDSVLMAGSARGQAG